MGVAAVHRIGVLAMTTTLAMSTSYADIPRGYDAFASRNGRFELRLMSPMSSEPQLWSLVERQTTGIRYTIQASFASQWVYVSDDGRYLGALDYSCPGEATLGHQVLRFFEDGVLKRAYALGELVADTRYSSRTISHWLWSAEDLIGWPTPRPKYLDAGGRFSITTLDLIEHVFDIASGQRVDVHCSSVVPKGAVVLSGKVRKIGSEVADVPGRRFTVSSTCALCDGIAGEGEVSFEVSKDFKAPAELGWLERDALGPITEHWATVFLRDGQLIGALGVLVGHCR